MAEVKKPFKVAFRKGSQSLTTVVSFYQSPNKKSPIIDLPTSGHQRNK